MTQPINSILIDILAAQLPKNAHWVGWSLGGTLTMVARNGDRNLYRNYCSLAPHRDLLPHQIGNTP
ncbi:MAG: hypothetical protein R3E08_11990 [Thiotrichaceae bacterium]